MGNTENIKNNLTKGLEKINKTINSFDTPHPEKYPTDPDKIMEDVQCLNKLLKRHQKILQVIMEFRAERKQLAHQSQEKRLIPGSMMKYNEEDEQGEIVKVEGEAEEKMQKTQRKSYNIVVNIEETYRLLTLLKNFENQEFELQEKRRSYQNSTSKQTPFEQKQTDFSQCILCCNCKVESVLPCAHAYCADCVKKFIIDKEEKKCPMCRKQFRESLNQNIYELVDQWDSQFLNETRKLFFDILSKRNMREVQKVLAKSKIKYQKMQEKNEEEEEVDKKYEEKENKEIEEEEEEEEKEASQHKDQ